MTIKIDTHAEALQSGENNSDQTFDFSKAPFWIATGDGQLQPVYGASHEDLIDMLREGKTQMVASDFSALFAANW